MGFTTYFKRATFKNNVTRIYPVWFGGFVIFFYSLAVFIVYYFKKIQKNDELAMLGMIFIYIICICEFYIRYKVKTSYFSKGFEMGKNTDFYINKVKKIFPVSIIIAIGTDINIFIGLTITQRYTLYDIYWVWMTTIVILLVFEPLLDITTGFNDEFILTDKKIINLNYVQEIHITKERNTFKGRVYEVEFWANGEKVGIDRYFDEDFFKMKNFLLEK